MPATALRIIDADTTQLAATIGGVEWSGIRCHLENGVIVVDGDGEIPDAVREWIAAGNVPTPFALSTMDLLAYANAKQWALATGGFVYTPPGGSPYPRFATTVDALSLMAGKVQRLDQPSPPVSFLWQFDAVTFVAIPAADFTAAAVACADFVQETFDTLAEVTARIVGPGADIATFADIDAATWPAAHN